MALSIVTLAPEELSLFLMRHRRGGTLERFEPRLDHFLNEILAKANAFVPSVSGAILLDDPKAKLTGEAVYPLTLIASFGAHAAQLLGKKIDSDQGIVGQVYSTGQPQCCVVEEREQCFNQQLEQETGLHADSLLGVPVVLGNSICGVLLLINRLGTDCYSEEERKLIEIFAGYISSSIQNILDGIRAKELARRDDLTGLFNDRYFHFRLREEINRADAAENPLSLLFLDLDHFKLINDRFGHLEGSRTLHELGILIEGQTPENAVSARFGGDEFVIILPGCDVAAAVEVATHLLEEIRSINFTAEMIHTMGKERSVITASIGVASLRDHVPPHGNIIQRANAMILSADAAMYRGKAEGRNRVVVALEKTKEYPIVTSFSGEPPNPQGSGSA